MTRRATTIRDAVNALSKRVDAMDRGMGAAVRDIGKRLDALEDDAVARLSDEEADADAAAGVAQ